MPSGLSVVAQQRCVFLEENLSALMHGNNSDGRVCVLEVCAARDSPFDQYRQTETS